MTQTLIAVTEIFTADGGEIYRSTDGGTTWALVATTAVNSGFNGVATDGGGVWCATHADKIYRSTDDGITWGVIYTDPDGGTFYKIATDGSDVWCAANNYCSIFRSADNGATWSKVFDDYAARGSEVGPIATDGAGNWLACEYNSSSKTRVYGSVDNGASWALAGTVTNATARSLYCMGTDGAGVWIIGTRKNLGATALVMRSIDLGANWTAVQGLSVADNTSVAADGVGNWCMGTYNSGKIFRSSDDGVTWEEVYDPPSPTTTIEGLCTDGEGAWWCGSYQEAELHKSANAGATWGYLYTFHPDSHWVHDMAIGGSLCPAPEINVGSVRFV